MTDPRRRIPGVDVLLASPAFVPLLERAERGRVAETLRGIQAELRSEPAEPPEAPEWYAAAVAARLERAERRSLRRVLNATGVVLHTNLGRAPLPEAARRAVAAVAGYATLEYDEEGGRRGSRHAHCTGLLVELTGAEAALVVNNNAAAVVLALNTLASGGGVVVSRGELVEIGGSFRVPDILARSGASLREVGATNRTHERDYRAALADDPRAILKVHRSNFRVEGFTAEVGLEALAVLAREAGIPLIHDLGSGALLDLTEAGLAGEPTAGASLAAGADVVTLSGDKLLGGPQAGIILGRADLVGQMQANPLARALRCDKLTLAALEATLVLYLDPARARREIPVLRMLLTPVGHLAERAAALAGRLSAAGVPAAVSPSTSLVGGGAFPGVELPTTVVSVALEGEGSEGGEALARRLRTGTPAVVARVRDGALLLDPRSLDPSEEDELVAAVVAASRDGAGG
jgi:L-seryl-tRNA(Ser) seleniumtransferase